MTPISLTEQNKYNCTSSEFKDLSLNKLRQAKLPISLNVK